jgi:hypothetical protein
MTSFSDIRAGFDPLKRVTGAKDVDERCHGGTQEDKKGLHRINNISNHESWWYSVAVIQQFCSVVQLFFSTVILSHYPVSMCMIS